MKKILSLLLIGAFVISFAVTPASAEENISMLTVFPTVTLSPTDHSTDRTAILTEVVEAAKKEIENKMIPSSNSGAIYANEAQNNSFLPSETSLLIPLLG